MADYNITIDEAQSEYEYELGVTSYKIQDGISEDVNWEVAQADPDTFSSVKFCPNGASCTDVIASPSAEFNGSVRNYTLKFSFTAGASNGTYNIFLQQRESLNLLNIEIVRNVNDIESIFFDFPNVHNAAKRVYGWGSAWEFDLKFPESYTAEIWNSGWGDFCKYSLDGGQTWTALSTSHQTIPAGVYNILLYTPPMSSIDNFYIYLTDGVNTYSGNVSWKVQNRFPLIGKGKFLQFWEDCEKNKTQWTFTTQNTVHCAAYLPDETLISDDFALSLDSIYNFLATDVNKSIIPAGTVFRIVDGNCGINSCYYDGKLIYDYR